VVAIYNHPEASKLGLSGPARFANNRGQESAGIISSDTHTLHAHKAMGLVADIFTQPTLDKLPASTPSVTPVIPPPATVRC